MPHLNELNACTRDDFVAAVGDIFEHAAWVADAAFATAPVRLRCCAARGHAARGARGAERAQLGLIRGHPELGSKVARAGDLTEASKAEQGSLGLDRLSDAEFARFERLNKAYRDKFAFPFIVCVRRHTRDSILAQFERRLHTMRTPSAHGRSTRSA